MVDASGDDARDVHCAGDRAVRKLGKERTQRYLETKAKGGLVRVRAFTVDEQRAVQSALRKSMTIVRKGRRK